MAIDELAEAELADTADFIELGTVPKLGDYLRDLWSRREFAIFVPYHDLRVQKMNTLVGQFWHFLNPAFTFLVYFVIFGLILDVRRGIDNYVGFLVIGVLLFTVMTRVMTDGLNSIEANSGLIRSVDFPRALLPVTSVIGQMMAFVPALVVLFGALFLTGESPSLRWLLVVPGMVLVFFICLGTAWLMARAGFAVRDLAQIVQHVIRLLFYASGVLFQPSDFIDSEVGVRLFAINPLYDVLTFMRWALMGLPMKPEVPILLIFYSIVLPVSGLIIFMRAEHKYAGS